MKCLKCKKEISKNQTNKYGLHIECFTDWFNVAEGTDFDSIFRKDSGSEENIPEKLKRINSSFFQGKFKKYSARLGNDEYILKVQEEDFPGLPGTEYVCNQIAWHLNIEVPPFYIIDFHGLMTFATKNFIDKKKRMVLHHIYHYLGRSDKFDVKTLIKIIEKHTGRLSETERFVRLCLFDALIGNHDRHGRNLAFLEEKGRLSLSPFYDNPSYIGVEEEILLGAQHSPRGKIATVLTEEPSMQDYVKQFIDLGYREICRNFYDKIDMIKITSLIEESPVSEQRKKALMRLIDERYKELGNAIKI